MLNSIALAPLKKIINLYLRLDPTTSTRLLSIKNKIIKIELIYIDSYFFLKIYPEGIDIQTKSMEPADAIIQISSLNLMMQWRAIQKQKIKFSEGIEIKGDLSLVQQIAELFSEIEIDWEEYLSWITGDIIAHQFGNGIRKVYQWLVKQESNLQMNVSEYIQEEIRLLPPKQEVIDFLSDIDILRDDVARLIARIQRLLNNSSSLC